MRDIIDLSILYVEDEPELRDHVAYALRLHINTVATAANGQEALEGIRSNRPDIVISDIRMPVMDGLELAATLRRKYPDLPIILCTAFTDTTYLLKAIELGVAAYVPKPIDIARLLSAIRQAALPIIQRHEIQRLKSKALQSCGILNSTSPAIATLGEQINHVADSDFSVIVRGEPGTGKGAIAELLHSMSRRMRKPLLTVDCQSRSAEQLEAELFGKMTGRGRLATTRDTGTLREINDGTLVLDTPEVLPLPLQTRLLALLEKQAYVPTGGTESLPCNVRVITITSIDLEKEALAGNFLHSLWLRLSDVLLCLPPLRDRSQDIPGYCQAFLAQAADDLGQPCPQLTPDAIRLLQAEPWPGNFRQLKHLLRRAFFRAGTLITAEQLKPLFNTPSVAPVVMPEGLSSLKLTDLEEWAITRALHATGGKKMQAAELLGISYNAFKDKLKRYGM